MTEQLITSDLIISGASGTVIVYEKNEICDTCKRLIAKIREVPM